jgi:hypothetical protein
MTFDKSTRRVKSTFRSCHLFSYPVTYPIVFTKLLYRLVLISTVTCSKFIITLQLGVMSDDLLLTPEASGSTSKSPTKIADTEGKKRARDSNPSSPVQSTKKAKAENVNREVAATETKGVFCHQSVNPYHLTESR